MYVFSLNITIFFTNMSDLLWLFFICFPSALETVTVSISFVTAVMHYAGINAACLDIQEKPFRDRILVCSVWLIKIWLISCLTPQPLCQMTTARAQYTAHQSASVIGQWCAAPGHTSPRSPVASPLTPLSCECYVCVSDNLPKKIVHCQRIIKKCKMLKRIALWVKAKHAHVNMLCTVHWSLIILNFLLDK